MIIRYIDSRKLVFNYKLLLNAKEKNPKIYEFYSLFRGTPEEIIKGLYDLHEKGDVVIVKAWIDPVFFIVLKYNQQSNINVIERRRRAGSVMGPIRHSTPEEKKYLPISDDILGSNEETGLTKKQVEGIVGWYHWNKTAYGYSLPDPALYLKFEIQIPPEPNALREQHAKYIRAFIQGKIMPPVNPPPQKYQKQKELFFLFIESGYDEYGSDLVVVEPRKIWNRPGTEAKGKFWELIFGLELEGYIEIHQVVEQEINPNAVVSLTARGVRQLNLTPEQLQGTSKRILCIDIEGKISDPENRAMYYKTQRGIRMLLLSLCPSGNNPPNHFTSTIMAKNFGYNSPNEAMKAVKRFNDTFHSKLQEDIDLIVHQDDYGYYLNLNDFEIVRE